MEFPCGNGFCHCQPRAGSCACADGARKGARRQITSRAWILFIMLKRGERIISAQIRGFNAANLVFGVTQNRLFGLTCGGNSARSVVGGFLEHVSRVSASPFPADLVSRRGAIQSLPPRQISLAPEAPVHRLNNVSRIGKNADLARMPQRFQPDCGRGNFRLLVCFFAEIFAKCLPVAFVAEQRHRCGAARLLSIAETRAVAVNFDLLQPRKFLVVTWHCLDLRLLRRSLSYLSSA